MTPDAMLLSMRITVGPANRTGTNAVMGNLTIPHDVEIRVLDFLELCKILGEFDALAKRLEEARK
jgi:hypothetical protein